MVPDHVWFGHVSRGTLIIVRILPGKFKKRWMEEIGLRKMRYKEYIGSRVIPWKLNLSKMYTLTLRNSYEKAIG